MNNIDILIIKNFNYLSGELLPYGESVISVKEVICVGDNKGYINIKFDFNSKFKILKLFPIHTTESYCRNDIEITYYCDIHKRRKDKIEKLLSYEK